MGDGICDCCDGSDEEEGACASRCTEASAEWRAKRAEQIRVAEQGSAKKQKYVEEAKQAISERKQDLQVLQVRGATSLA